MRANAWLLRPALDLLNVLLIVVGDCRVRHAARRGRLQIGLLYAFISYIARVVDPLIQITLQFSLLQQAVIAAARVNTLLQEGADARQRAGQRRISRGRGRASRRSASATTRPQPVLHDLSLEVPAGSFYGIVGHTGAARVHAAVAAAALLLAAGRAHRDRRRAAGADRRRAVSRRCRPGAAGAVPAGRAARARTSTWVAACREPRSKRPRAPRVRTTSSCALRQRLRHAAGRRRRAAVVRAEAADRGGPRAGGPAAHPVPRRGHLAHRQRNRTDACSRR